MFVAKSCTGGKSACDKLPEAFSSLALKSRFDGTRGAAIRSADKQPLSIAADLKLQDNGTSSPMQ